MKICVLSDAHGNLQGLSACLREARRLGAERIFYLGDAFGYGEDGCGVLDALLRENAVCLLGNHDAMLLKKLPIAPEKARVYRLEERDSLPQTQLSYLQALLPYHQETVDGRRLLFVHGHPYDPLCGYLYPDGDMERFAGLPFDGVFMGHTHRPFQKREGGTLLVNVGSCGLPRDIGNSPSFALYDTESGACAIHRIVLEQEEMEQSFLSGHPSVLACLKRR